MKIKQCSITNISSQILVIIYNNITINKNVSNIRSINHGGIQLLSGKVLDIEYSRLDENQIKFLLNKQLIKIDCRMVDIEIDEFDYDIQTSVDIIIRTPISLLPVVTVGIAKYWNIKNLPSNFSFNQSTGLISGSFLTDNINPVIVQLIGISSNNKIVTKNISFNIIVPIHIGLLTFNPFIGLIGLNGNGILVRN